MKPIIAITMGDPAGIGAEVTVRALTHRALYQICTPYVIGSAEALADLKPLCRRRADPACSRVAYGSVRHARHA